MRPGAGRGPRLAAALLAGACAVLVSAGCATIPNTSPPQVIPQSVPAAPADGSDLRYDEIVPRPGEEPQNIVRDFLRAGGSTERAHTRARAYLTPSASKTWKDTAGAVIIEDRLYLDAPPGGAVVQLGAQQHARLDDDGSYVPGEAAFHHSFQLKKVNGEWRIDNPPPGLVLESSTFDAAYRAYKIYFLNSTRTKVVPDIRWYAAPLDSLPTLLVTALERGPSKWLEDSVMSDLAGITLQTNIVQERDRVKVYLTNLDEQAETLTDGGFAQLVWTLGQVGVGGVEVYADGVLIKPPSAPDRPLQQLEEWLAYDPDALSANASAYFIRDGAVWTTEDAPLAGPAGRTSYRALSVATSIDESAVAVVHRTAGGKELSIGPPGSLRSTVSGSTLSRPTWGSRNREVWTVRDGRDVLLVALDRPTTRVDVPQQQRIGSIRALSLSRDGSRVAVVAGPPGREQLWIGVVIRDNGSTEIQGLRPLDLGDVPVSDVSWADAVTVIALVRSGEQDSSFYSMEVDGGSSAVLVPTTGLPGPPTAVAAGPTLLTIAAGTLWRTPVGSESWSKVEDRSGGESAPAYPG
jgi:Lipoprotein LpqB beta-propeller domain/Sporulation and spore germination